MEKNTKPVTPEEVTLLVQEILTEYINEAHHQDGQDFWENFKTADEAVVDFSRYISDRLFS